MRATASPSTVGGIAEATVSIVADAGLVPPEPDDSIVDRVLAWTTMPLDRHRLRDRLRELRLRPWAAIAGEGARLRLAAARAALATLIEATPEQTAGPAPDLVVVAGGAFATAPGPAIALVVADVLRRPSAIAIAHDHARLLAPLGSIPDGVERRQAVRDLADDLLAPLGSVVIPAGIRAGTSAGRLVVHTGSASTETDLVPGGLGGLLVDLRDVPLRLPERPERRRELLEAWQESLWVTRDR
jgi:hypothetical protein